MKTNEYQCKYIKLCEDQRKSKKPKKVKLGLASWETPASKAVPRVAAVEKRMAKEGAGWEARLARASEGRVQAKVGGAADVWRAVDGAAGWATHSTDHLLVTCSCLGWMMALSVFVGPTL